MLTAKFLRTGKGGSLAIYEVRGTSTELANFVAANYTSKGQEPAFKSEIDGTAILDNNGNKVPLLFTSYPMPGKNNWHPLYQAQSGKNKGSWSLDKENLNFDALVAKSLGADLGQSIASELAKSYTDKSVISSSAQSLLTDDDDDSSEDSEENFASSADETNASEDANLDADVPTATKKGNR
jgi:hypothetical protein